MKDGLSKSQRTKEALGESYRRLLSEKPPSKITVVDIAEGCGVTVPTFYNHFKDKYSLIVWIYVNDSAKIMDKIGSNGYEWKDTILDAMRYFSDNRDFVFGALAHVSGETQFMSIMEEVNVGLLSDEIRKKLRPGEEIPEDVSVLVKLYCLGTVRYVYGWLIDDSPMPPEKVADIFIDALPNRLRYYLMRIGVLVSGADRKETWSADSRSIKYAARD